MSGRSNRDHELAEREQEQFLKRSAISYAECAVNLMATAMPADEVAAWLEAQARDLRQYG